MLARRVTIAGGGLAGLSLGIALRRQDIPVQVLEATSYPRHRVCGEFISGIRPEEINALGIGAAFSGASQHRTTAWFDGDRPLLQHALPEPAHGISRHHLDRALAEQFQTLGGNLICSQRCTDDAEGTVWASGRVKQNGDWIGLKAHFEHLEIAADLEVHLSSSGYVGLTRIENGRINVCGLFHRGTPLHSDSPDASALTTAVRQVGLPVLAERLESAQCDRDSLKGVTHFSLGWQMATDQRLRIGDAAVMIPPFTGNGMTMAFQGALAAVPALVAWSRGQHSWDQTRNEVMDIQRHLFASRLRWARALQTILLRPWGRRVVPLLMRSGCLRFDTLYRKLR